MKKLEFDKNIRNSIGVLGLIGLGIAGGKLVKKTKTGNDPYIIGLSIMIGTIGVLIYGISEEK